MGLKKRIERRKKEKIKRSVKKEKREINIWKNVRKTEKVREREKETIITIQ